MLFLFPHLFPEVEGTAILPLAIPFLRGHNGNSEILPSRIAWKRPGAWTIHRRDLSSNRRKKCWISHDLSEPLKSQSGLITGTQPEVWLLDRPPNGAASATSQTRHSRRM